jgi:hypothetical protein
MNMNISAKLENGIYCFGEIPLRAGLRRIQGDSPGKLPIYIAKHGKIIINIINNLQHYCRRLSIHLYAISQDGTRNELKNEYFPKVFENDELTDTIVIQDGRHTFPHSGTSKRILHLVCIADGFIFDLDYFYLFAEVPKTLPTHFMEKRFAAHNAKLGLMKMHIRNRHRTQLLRNTYSDPFEAFFQNIGFGGIQQDHGLNNQTFHDSGDSIPNNQVQTGSHRGNCNIPPDIFEELDAPDPLMEVDDLILM